MPQSVPMLSRPCRSALLLALLGLCAAAPSSQPQHATTVPGSTLQTSPHERRSSESKTPYNLAAVPLPVPMGAGTPSVVMGAIGTHVPFTDPAFQQRAGSWLYAWWAAAGGAGACAVGQAQKAKPRRRRRTDRRSAVVGLEGASGLAAESIFDQVTPAGRMGDAIVFAVPAASPEAALASLAAASGHEEVPKEWSVVAATQHLERSWHAPPEQPWVTRTPSEMSWKGAMSTAAGTETPQSSQWETSSQAASEQWHSLPSEPRSTLTARPGLRWTAKDADQEIAHLRSRDAQQKHTSLRKVLDATWPMALSRHGCRIVQAALDAADSQTRFMIADSFRSRVREALKSPHANHVLQRCVAVLPPDHIRFVISEMEGYVKEIARHPFGCRVLERIIEHCPQAQTEGLAQEVIADALDLSRHPYGNYVVQHILEHGTTEHRHLVAKNLMPAVRVLARHKIASNVVEKVLTYCEENQREQLKQRIVGNPQELASLEHSNYGSFVVKELKRR